MICHVGFCDSSFATALDLNLSIHCIISDIIITPSSFPLSCIFDCLLAKQLKICRQDEFTEWPLHWIENWKRENFHIVFPRSNVDCSRRLCGSEAAASAKLFDYSVLTSVEFIRPPTMSFKWHDTARLKESSGAVIAIRTQNTRQLKRYSPNPYLGGYRARNCSTIGLYFFHATP